MKAIVFSRDRACQLDLLLTSLEKNAPGVFEPTVIWRATWDRYRKSYLTCAKEHPDTQFLQEDGLTYQVRSAIARARGLLAFFTDDDVLYRKVWPISELDDEFICLSLRLGRNTTYCYPHARKQKVPEEIAWKEWVWEGADGDFGYPMSLDGHIYRANDLARILDGRHFSGPNFLEEVLMAGAKSLDSPLMCCYPTSRLVGIPVNRVQKKRPNRHAEKHSYSVQELNDRYQLGQRIDLDALDFSDIRGAHQELELIFR